MRGDFSPLGFVLIMRLKHRHQNLSPGGLGREIDFSVDLKKVGTPSLSIATQVLGLFA
jgi:phage protein U